MPAEDSTWIVLPSGAAIARSELRFEFSRSGGPGGQNVNKVSTRVTLLFDLARTESLAPPHKAAIRSALGGRINHEGILRVVSSKHRTQVANRQAAVERFEELLASALTPRRRRKKTIIPARAHARRLEVKARTGEKKRRRGHATPDD